MRTSHKLTRLFLALTALMALASVSFAQPIVGTATNGATNQIQVSDQKPGSVLVFPYYVSDINAKWDTRITISNTATGNIPVNAQGNFGLYTNSIIVHVFMVQGSNCSQADFFLCLTKGASMSFRMLEQDPGVTGTLIAVAVDYQGLPVSWNALIGNAFVNRGTWQGNYGAEAFASTQQVGWRTTTANNTSVTAGLLFNGTPGNGGGPGALPTMGSPIVPDNTANPTTAWGYDQIPNQFAVEIQSPVDAPGQRVVHAGLEGSLATGSLSGAGQVGTGLVWRGDEKQGSFTRWLSGGCQGEAVIADNTPRVPLTLAVFIPKGQIGVLRYDTGPSVGILITPFQFEASPAVGVKTGTWGGIRTLHKTRVAATTTLTIPVYMPVC
jgi:hypothetical protein